MATISRISKAGLITLIRLYRLILSPLIGTCCRFEPTCSQYAMDALNTYGVVKGGYFVLRRLLRCHPWHPGGYDPINSSTRSPLC